MISRNTFRRIRLYFPNPYAWVLGYTSWRTPMSNTGPRLNLIRNAAHSIILHVV